MFTHTPCISLAHSCFLAPWFCGRTRSGRLRDGKRRENNGEWGSGAACPGGGGGDRARHPVGASCACSSLLSFVPPQRRGCRESGFLPGTGLIHGPPGGRGKEEGGGGAGVESTLGTGVLEGAEAG